MQAGSVRVDILDNLLVCYNHIEYHSVVCTIVGTHSVAGARQHTHYKTDNTDEENKSQENENKVRICFPHPCSKLLLHVEFN